MDFDHLLAGLRQSQVETGASQLRSTRTSHTHTTTTNCHRTAQLADEDEDDTGFDLGEDDDAFLNAVEEAERETYVQPAKRAKQSTQLAQQRQLTRDSPSSSASVTAACQAPSAPSTSATQHRSQPQSQLVNASQPSVTQQAPHDARPVQTTPARAPTQTQQTPSKSHTTTNATPHSLQTHARSRPRTSQAPHPRTHSRPHLHSTPTPRRTTTTPTPSRGFSTPPSQRTQSLSQVTKLVTTELRSNSAKAGPRRFPGPAGALPELKSLEDLSKPLFELSPRQFPARRRLDDASHFDAPPWSNMLQQSKSNSWNRVRKTNLAAIMATGSFAKIPYLAVVIKSIAVSGQRISVVVSDPTARMKGAIHHNVFESVPPDALVEGSVLVLRQVSIFTPTPHSYYVNITAKNLVSLFKLDGSELKLERSSHKSPVQHISDSRNTLAHQRQQQASQSQLQEHRHAHPQKSTTPKHSPPQQTTPKQQQKQQQSNQQFPLADEAGLLDEDDLDALLLDLSEED
eukprot:m.45991 g.45991  ORF g.45991 m.45991 type:complete len:514 (-) comp10909_c0_seq4:133-1674(-)